MMTVQDQPLNPLHDRVRPPGTIDSILERLIARWRRFQQTETILMQSRLGNTDNPQHQINQSTCERPDQDNGDESVREQVVQIALPHPEWSPRELACHITDTEEYFISESSVYRILKTFDLITIPALILLKAADKFSHPTKRVLSSSWIT